jgi:hypothetical protein
VAKSRVIEEEERASAEVGTALGTAASLADIYVDYVFDLWTCRERLGRAGFRSWKDAEQFGF